ncbi:MAG: cytochrome c3 family protein [Gallionellaceae bacterium]|nr:cytochrome c3 family protein [Gallionellaceae bacterium]
MKTFNSRLAGVLSASALAIGLIAIAQPALAAVSGIAFTRHNLGSSGTSGAHLAASGGANGDASFSSEICVFCHTPHGSNTAVTAPLWNKSITNTASSYTNYTSSNSATFDAQAFGPGPVSLACLSCHDGTQAMDNIINEPGSAATTTAYSTNGNGTSGRAYTWNGSNRINVEGFLGGGTASVVAMLGTDLVNDHPVGINYCAASNTTGTTVTCGDTDFNAVQGAAGSKRYIDTGTLSNGFQKTDLPLYTDGAVTIVSTIRVECATCHDPHVYSSTGVPFLRTANDGSGVCLACHNK